MSSSERPPAAAAALFRRDDGPKIMEYHTIFPYFHVRADEAPAPKPPVGSAEASVILSEADSDRPRRHIPSKNMNEKETNQ